MKTYIWALPTRIFHCLLAVGFFAAYVLSGYENYLNWHYAFGAMVGVLMLFRLIFGFVGPQYSHFKDFQLSVGKAGTFLRRYFSQNTYAGHNPMAAWIMLLIILLALLCSISGLSLYATTHGLIKIMKPHDIMEIHEVFANLLMLLVALHLLGVAGDIIFHGKLKTLGSIVTGYKNIKAQNVKLSIFQKLFAVIWFVAALFVFYIALGL
jgi:cytochrome b